MDHKDWEERNTEKIIEQVEDILDEEFEWENPVHTDMFDYVSDELFNKNDPKGVLDSTSHAPSGSSLNH